MMQTWTDCYSFWYFAYRVCWFHLHHKQMMTNDDMTTNLWILAGRCLHGGKHYFSLINDNMNNNLQVSNLNDNAEHYLHISVMSLMSIYLICLWFSVFSVSNNYGFFALTTGCLWLIALAPGWFSHPNIPNLN